MRILLDHCLDWRLGRHLPTHDVKRTRDLGWEGLKNGKLLAQAAAQFDVLLTVDQNLKYQQALPSLPIAVIVLIATTNRLQDLIPLVPRIEQALQALVPRSLVEVRLP